MSIPVKIEVLESEEIAKKYLYLLLMSAKAKAPAKRKGKAPRRLHILPLASVKHLMLKGASPILGVTHISTTVSHTPRKYEHTVRRTTRISEKAINMATAAAAQFIKKLADHCNAYLYISGGKTITAEIFGEILENESCKISASNVQKHVALLKEATKRGLPVARVIRIFKNHLSGKDRLSEDAKSLIVASVEVYLMHLAMHAANYASSGKRHTIKLQDVQTAIGHVM